MELKEGVGMGKTFEKYDIWDHITMARTHSENEQR